MEKINSHLKRFVAIDGNSLVHRAFHAFPPELATSAGVQVNAVYGFTSMLLRVLSELHPKYLVCAFDRRGPTFRHTEFAGYKAKRKPTDESLIKQFPLVKDILTAFNVPILEKDGYEADDILGTMGEYVKRGKWKNENIELIIVTGDKDLLQVVEDGVKVWLPHGSFKDLVMYDENGVKKKFGFTPEFVPDYKALVGDPSDNIPGVKGIGDKSALMLIKKYGCLDNIYKHIDEIVPRLQNLLVEGEESAAMSHKLATIVTNIDFNVKLEDCLMRDFNREEVLKKFQEFEFHSLVSRIPDSISQAKGEQMGLFGSAPTTKKAKASAAQKDDVKGIENLEIDQIIRGKDLKDVGFCYFDTHEFMIGFRFSKKTDIYYCKNIFEGDTFRKNIFPIFENANVPVVSMGWESFCRDIYQFDLSKKEKLNLFKFAKTQLFDCDLVAYFLSGGKRDYSLKTLAFQLASMIVPETSLSSVENCNICINAVFSIEEVLRQELKKHHDSMGLMFGDGMNPIDSNPISNVEMPLSLSLAEMTANGIMTDTDELKKMDASLATEIKETERKIYDLVGHEFNVSSSRQVADILFNELKLTVHKRTKTGYSTAEGVLVKLVDAHPVVPLILGYRELVKIKSTYIEPLVKYAKESKDGRVHSTFHQDITATGRLSSVNPNLQNIPVRSDLGKKVKETFISPKGKVLISADYSQIELRIMADFSNDELMIKDFKRGADFHTVTAARIFEKDAKDVTKDERRVAKTINFGIMYGLSAFGLSESLRIDRQEAAKYIQEYFEKYPKVQDFIRKTVDFVKGRGYVESLLGRRRYISGILSSNRVARAAYEREAINMPLQSTAADIMRMAMNEVYEWILKQSDDIGLLLQIHDQLIIECDEKIARSVAKKVKEIMEGVIKLKVPLVVDVGYGKSMNSVKPL